MSIVWWRLPSVLARADMFDRPVTSVTDGNREENRFIGQFWISLFQNKLRHWKKRYTELCETFLPSSENHPQNVQLPTPKMHYGTIFQPDILETWQEYFYSILYLIVEICEYLGMT